MNSVGIDLHKSRSHVVAVDEGGRKILSRRINNDSATFLELLAEVDGESKIALEATYGWEWLADVLEEAGYELHLAHPLRTKAIASARVKTDSVDALTLAHLLRTDLLPEAYIAPRELRDLRDLLRHRVALTHMRSALKNRVHALLARQGIRHQHSDLFGKAGGELLAGLELREPRAATRLDARADRRLRPRDRRDYPRDRPARQARRPRRSALPDPRRRALHRDARDRRDRRHHPLSEGAQAMRLGRAHPDRQKLRRQGRLGHITRQGSRPLRWALVEAAQHSVRGSGPLRVDFERISKKIAKVAVARKILTLCYYGLRDGEIRCLARR